jgi:hypothetical protein
VASILVAATGVGCSFDGHGYDVAADGVPDAGATPDATVVPPAPDAAPVGPAFCDEDDPDLVACFRFDDAHDLLVDGSAYANDGHDEENLLRVDGPPGHGGALHVLAGGKMAIDDDASLDCTNAITLEFWLRLDALPMPDQRFGLVDNDGQYGIFVNDAGQVRCMVGPTVVNGLHPVVGTWSHIACTYDGAQVTLYQDGVAEVTTPSVVTMTTGNDKGMRVGMNSPDKDELVGAIDDVRVFRAARSAAAVCAAAGRKSCVKP